MRSPTQRFLAGAALLGAALALLLAAVPAEAQSKQKSKQARGTFKGFDAAASTITLLEGGKEIVYKVKPEGSVLSRTTVKINGVPMYVKDIPEGAPIIVYWRPDEADKEQRFARSIDAPRVPPELMDEDE